MAAPTYREIDGDPITWTDPAGVTHLCEAADAVPGGGRLIWTLCDRGGAPGARDVPPGRAEVGSGKLPTCRACMAEDRRRVLGAKPSPGS